jgi:hypothetical protein
MANLVKASDAKLKGLRRKARSQPATERWAQIITYLLCNFPPPLRLDGGGVFLFKEVNNLQLVKPDNGQVIAESVEFADSFFKRLKGLMFRKQIPTGYGLYLPLQIDSHVLYEISN